MKCPNCHSTIATRLEHCPRCDWQLNASTTVITAGDHFSNDTGWDDEPVWNPETLDQSIPQIGATWDQMPLPSVAAPPNSALIASSVPTTTLLTGSQKFQLFVNALLPFTSVALFIWLVLQFEQLVANSFVWMIVGVFGLIGGWQITLQLLDVFSGVAHLQVDRLSKTQVVKYTSRPLFYGHFERVGRLNIGPINHKVAQHGAIYQILYSRHSKQLWMMKQVG